MGAEYTVRTALRGSTRLRNKTLEIGQNNELGASIGSAEQGSHAELMVCDGGEYRNFVNLQAVALRAL